MRASFFVDLNASLVAVVTLAADLAIAREGRILRALELGLR
jgi:hypothetical protein